MSLVKKRTVTVNLGKFSELRGDKSVAKYCEEIDFNPVMFYKIESGERWAFLENLAEFCVKTGTQPNDFFTISEVSEHN